MSLASIVYIILVGIVRWFFIFAPSWGFRLEEWDKFNLPEPLRKEAQIAHSAITTKISLLSWPPLAFAGVIFNIENVCQNGPAGIVWPIGIILCIILCVVFSRIDARLFAQSKRDIVVLIGLVIADMIVQFFANLIDKNSILCR